MSESQSTGEGIPTASDPIDTKLVKNYEETPIAKLPDAPVEALQGVSGSDAQALRAAFNIKTIRDLGTNKYFLWAQAIVTLAEPAVSISPDAVGPTSASIYLESDDPLVHEEVVAAVRQLVDALGYEEPEEYSERLGSFFARWSAKAKRGLSSPEVTDRLIKVERALEAQYLGKAQAEIDAKEAEAVATLFKAIQDVPSACIRAGSILVLKYQDGGESVVLCRTLTQKEIHILEKYPEIQASPRNAIERLAMVADQDGIDTSGSD